MRNADEQWLGPYQHGRKARYIVLRSDGSRRYESIDLYGPWPKQGVRKAVRTHRSRKGRYKPIAGFVYLVQCGGDRGPIKIGIAADVAKRFYTLQNGCPYELRVVASRWDDDCQQTEAMLLAQFSAQRIRGEWFTWSQELQDALHTGD